MTETLPAAAGRDTSGAVTRTKLIEVALPLEAINVASAREKSIRHGHPSTLHLWWARRPLAACRAVLFAQMVDDPSALPEEFPTEEAQDAERQRIFRIIEDLVLWENSTNETVLNAARREIARSVARTAGVPLPETPDEVRRVLREHAPPVLDPFCGGGSIPLEAQRLGLEAHASDLNPVAVLITKALIEIPPKFAGMTPINPRDRGRGMGSAWKGAAGLAADVRYYGEWMREEAFKRIGHLYPKARLEDGTEATVIAWLWARTVKCPNPACGAQMPLLTTLTLSSKSGRQRYLSPVIVDREVSFAISTEPPAGLDAKRGYKRGISGIFACVVCGSVTTRDYVASEGEAGRIGSMQTAVVAETHGERTYLPSATSALPKHLPAVDTYDLDTELSANPRDLWCRNFGLRRPCDLFTHRQLVAMTTFSDLVRKAREQVMADALQAGMSEGESLRNGGEAAAYADAVATYLAFGVDKATDRNTSLCSWESGMNRMGHTFVRQALPMVWDYVETNPFAGAGGDIGGTVASLAEAFQSLPGTPAAHVHQAHAANLRSSRRAAVVSTDPPYYDNIGYADLSDFFYVWLRRSLQDIYPSLFNTLLVPKAQELVAAAHRFNGSREQAENFFRSGLGEAFVQMRELGERSFPMTIYYAFKQAENTGRKGAVVSTGWETMLAGLLDAGFSVTGTWPMRSELSNRMIASGTNALASSIVLVCRMRPDAASLATRGEFLRALKRELPGAIRKMQQGNIAPVDLAQASIGPGMAVFSRYSKVLEANGEAMSVRTALGIINTLLDEVLQEQESEYDADTRWAVAWFEQYGVSEGPYGDALTLSTAKDSSVEAMREAGVLQARAGKVRLLGREELEQGFDPRTDTRLTVWELTQHLVHAVTAGSEAEAAELLSRAGALGEVARDLAYRLFVVADRKGWTQEALAYNALVTAWSEITKLSGQAPGPNQSALFEEGDGLKP